MKAACHGKGSTKRVKELLDAGANIEERYRTFFVNGKFSLFCYYFIIKLSKFSKQLKQSVNNKNKPKANTISKNNIQRNFIKLFLFLQ